jgi:hypothetical protein
MKLKKLNYFIAIAVLAMLVGCIQSCQSNNTNKVGSTESTDPIFNFQAAPLPPVDVDTNASDTTLAAYAWQEFLALNWKSSYSTNGLKGNPDTNWTFFTDDKPVPDIVVWETYAHRSELSPYVYPMRPFDSACKYSYGSMPKPGPGSPSYGLLHNLDETSEIGSCNLVAFADNTNLYTDTFRVRYQAKVNRTEYDYIKNTYPTQDSLSNTVARTQRYFNKLFNGSGAAANDSLLLNLPNGSIEVKTAWRPLKPGEDATKFFTRTVIDYSNLPISGSVFTYTNKTYALIGIHIIHKSKNQPSFVFATWEHVGVMQDKMKYILLTQAQKSQTDSLGYMTPIRNPIPAIDSLATVYVHKNLLPATSVWQNYRLVGVQATPNSDVNKPNFFLANYVIESDSLLARFHGSGFVNPFDGKPNVYYNNNLYSVGGCQGCHGGGAQHTGTDFSFVVNSPNHSPDPVAGRPKGILTESQKLKRLMMRAKQ